MSTAGQCRTCGRPLNPDGCRDERLGWYCIIWGLRLDTSRIRPPRLIHPTPDPVSVAEQAIIDEYAPRLAAAEAALGQAQQEWTAAQHSVQQAALAAARLGVGTRLSVAVLDPHNLLKTRKNSPESDRHALIHAENQAADRFKEAERALDAARNRLNDLQRRQEREQRATRTPMAA
ncbi:hypothetical protein ACFWUZ_20560 [Streptomyces sp. NPDC058646]|uniref:hypothetical protein n=1 Tax=Streptomyces sp. NPDC058646 TaxID=3346574 RepID=UPI003665250C